MPNPCLTLNIADVAQKYGATFAQEEATSIDLSQKQVITNKQTHSYDYLVIATGAKTNFYGNEEAQKYAYPLYCAEDAIKIQETIKSNPWIPL